MKRIFFAMREVQLEDLYEEMLKNSWLLWIMSQRYSLGTRNGAGSGSGRIINSQHKNYTTNRFSPPTRASFNTAYRMVILHNLILLVDFS